MYRDAMGLYIPNAFVDNSNLMEELRSKTWSSPLLPDNDMPREY